MRHHDVRAVLRWGLTPTLAALLASCGSTNAAARAPTSQAPRRITIENQSHWAITQIYLAPQGGTWGDGQLGASDHIGTGESLEIRGLDCDSYDVKLVDEDRDECIIPGVDLCSAGAKWVFHDKELIACQRKTAAEPMERRAVRPAAGD